MSVLLQRLWIQLTADRKRFGLLCAVFGVAMLLWARIIVVSNVPRTAVADEHARATATAEGLDAPPWGDRTRAAVRGGHRQVVALDRLPVRDPFVISTRHFPRPSSDAQTEGNRDKSSLQPAEDSLQARARQLAVLKELAGRFRLEAVMQATDGRSALAVINGRSWRQGEEIPAVGNQEIRFVLVQVKHRSIVLQFEDHLFELNMDR